MPDPVAVNSMFGRIARRYDLANRLLSGGTDLWWRRRLVKAVKATQPRQILDLATGSGDVAFALADQLPDASITAVDFCQPMLDQAEQKKSAAVNPRFANIRFRQGDGMALPFAENSFDAVTISFGLRNMADRQRSLREMHRVLRPQGRLFVLEFSQPQAWLRPFYLFYLRKILPIMAGAVTGDRAAYVYLNETIEQFPNAPGLAREIQEAGFRAVAMRKMSFCIVALHEGTK
jgi:demethylmenaquinone methyltransferase/2-methoxy-6-polyprenyl-1,4-benzoquinol methylase